MLLLTSSESCIWPSQPASCTGPAADVNRQTDRRQTKRRQKKKTDREDRKKKKNQTEKTDKETEKTDKQTEKTNRQKRQTNRHTNRQTEKTNRQTEQAIGKQTQSRQTDKHKQTDTKIALIKIAGSEMTHANSPLFWPAHSAASSPSASAGLAQRWSLRGEGGVEVHHNMNMTQLRHYDQQQERAWSDGASQVREHDNYIGHYDQRAEWGGVMVRHR